MPQSTSALARMKATRITHSTRGTPAAETMKETRPAGGGSGHAAVIVVNGLTSRRESRQRRRSSERRSSTASTVSLSCNAAKQRSKSLAARCGETQACYQRGLEHVPRESVCCGGRAPRRSSRSRPSSTQMIQKMTRRPRGFRIAQVVCERGVRNLHTACRPPAEAVLGAAESNSKLL